MEMEHHGGRLHRWGANELSKPTTIAGFGSPSQCAQWAVGPLCRPYNHSSTKELPYPLGRATVHVFVFLSLITHLYFWWKQRSIRNIQKADQNVWSRDVRKSCCRNDQTLKSTSQLPSLISFAGSFWFHIRWRSSQRRSLCSSYTWPKVQLLQDNLPIRNMSRGQLAVVH